MTRHYRLAVQTVAAADDAAALPMLGSYGRFKHGDLAAITDYARLLAARLATDPAFNDQARRARRLVITSPPFARLPSASHYLGEQVARVLGKHASVPTSGMTILAGPPYVPLRSRPSSTSRDYARLDAIERADAQRQQLALLADVPDQLAGAEAIVVVNDARVTGSQELALRRFLDFRSSAASIGWAYIVDVDPGPAQHQPRIEDLLNQHAMSDDDFISGIAAATWCPTSRGVRRALSLPHESLRKVRDALGPDRCSELVVLARGEGLERTPSYRRALAVLETST